LQAIFGAWKVKWNWRHQWRRFCDRDTVITLRPKPLTHRAIPKFMARLGTVPAVGNDSIGALTAKLAKSIFET
jgi:hypothetical protein